MTSGIYKLYFEQNPNHFYIGSSNNIETRWRQHKSQLKSNKHDNSILLNAVNKYGHSNIKTEVIEECEQAILFIREQYYIDKLKPSYNIRKEAQGGKSKEYYVLYSNNSYSLVHGIKHQKFNTDLSKITNYSKRYAVTPEGYFYRRLTEEELFYGHYFSSRTGYMYILAQTTKRKTKGTGRSKVPLVKFTFTIDKKVLKSSYDLQEVINYRNLMLDPYSFKIPFHYRKLNEDVLIKYLTF